MVAVVVIAVDTIVVASSVVQVVLDGDRESFSRAFLYAGDLSMRFRVRCEGVAVSMHNTLLGGCLRCLLPWLPVAPPAGATAVSSAVEFTGNLVIRSRPPGCREV